jgi:dGTPase
LFKEAFARSKGTAASMRSQLINMLRLDLVDETTRQIERLRIETLDDVCRATEPIVRFSPDVGDGMKELKELMYEKMYKCPGKKIYRGAVRTIIRTMCDAYFHAPPEAVVRFYEPKATGDTADGRRARAVLDYVSSFSDRKAIAMAERLDVDASTLKTATTIYGVTPESGDNPE